MINEDGELASTDMEKAKVVSMCMCAHCFCCSDFVCS